MDDYLDAWDNYQAVLYKVDMLLFCLRTGTVSSASVVQDAGSNQIDLAMSLLVDLQIETGRIAEVRIEAGMFAYPNRV